MTIPSKRAEYAAIASLFLSVVSFFIAFFIGRWSGFFAVSLVSWLILSSVLTWIVLACQFHQSAMAEREMLDMGTMPADQQLSQIFQGREEKAGLLAISQRRLAVFEKWFLPVLSAIIAAYQAGIGWYLFKSIPSAADLTFKQPLVCAICMAAIAFLSFLMSRYATGMSATTTVPGWKPLRAGGSSLLAVALLCFALAVALAFAQFKFFAIVTAINYVIPVLLIILGIETAFNIILDIYRPRIKGRYSRSAFDSRLLAVINEPGQIFRTAASTIDYQFGFKVSHTWFYKLLEKAILPLVLFAALTLYLLSCIVVVGPNEQAIIEHFGSPVKHGESVTAGPGLTYKWPWPFGVAYKYPVDKIAQLNIGFVPKIDPRTGQPERGPRLWGKEHYEKEYQLLVASQQTAESTDSDAVPISLVMAAVPVQYKVKDLYAFMYNHNEPEKMLEYICYRELTSFASSATIDVDTPEDIQRSLLGAGRGEAERTLTENIQNAADAEGLGIEIVFVGLQGIHPPVEVAADYQKVVGAVQQKQAAILNALADRSGDLSALAGSVENADRLYTLAAEYQLAEKNGDVEKLQALGGQLDEAFAQASGEIFSTLRQAQSYAFEKATLAKATGQRFAGQKKAYDAAPNIYRRQQRLVVLEEALENIRKFVVVADKDDNQVFIVDVQEKLTPGLYDISGLQETPQK